MLRVCQISTYLPVQCGIATYTEALARALAERDDLDVTVLSEEGAVTGKHERVLSVPSFDRGQPWIDGLVSAAVAQKADVVHIQHAHDIFGMDRRLPELCKRLSEHGIPTLTTLHSVYTRRSGLYQRKLGVVRFHHELARYSHLLVHQRQGMHDVLRSQGIADDRISVIPHGTETLPELDRTSMRKRLDLPEEGPMLLCFGFIHMLKNLHTPIKAMALLKPEFPDARLVIAGSVQRGRWYNRAYLRYLEHLVGRLGLEQQVILRHGYVPDDDIEALYAASDLALLSHAQRYGSASGVAHLALATGTPVVFSDSPKFAELAHALGDQLQVGGSTPEHWAERLRGLLRDPQLMETMRARTQQLGRDTAWTHVAEQTADVYRMLASAP